MRILAIDPGKNCGWALRLDDGSYMSGCWNLDSRQHSSMGMFAIRLRGQLNAVRAGAEIDLVAYEQVAAHKGTRAAHIYGGIVTAIQQWCIEQGIEYVGIPVGTIKKHATGKGNANKDAMWKAAKAKWPDEIEGGVTGYDEVDARWVAETAAAELNLMQPP